jgi:hypothetical protein
MKRDKYNFIWCHVIWVRYTWNCSHTHYIREKAVKNCIHANALGPRLLVLDAMLPSDVRSPLVRCQLNALRLCTGSSTCVTVCSFLSSYMHTHTPMGNNRSFPCIYSDGLECCDTLVIHSMASLLGRPPCSRKWFPPTGSKSYGRVLLCKAGRQRSRLVMGIPALFSEPARSPQLTKNSLLFWLPNAL